MVIWQNLNLVDILFLLMEELLMLVTLLKFWKDILPIDFDFWFWFWFCIVFYFWFWFWFWFLIFDFWFWFLILIFDFDFDFILLIDSCFLFKSEHILFKLIVWTWTCIYVNYVFILLLFILFCCYIFYCYLFYFILFMCMCVRVWMYGCMDVWM